MVRVHQSEHGPGGDCYAACLATVLELPLSEVPDLRGDPRWGERLRAWLKPRGWRAAFIRGNGQPIDRQDWFPPGWSILGHRTVGRAGHVHAALFHDGALYHDPAGRVMCRGDSAVLLWTLLDRLDDKPDAVQLDQGHEHVLERPHP